MKPLLLAAGEPVGDHNGINGPRLDILELARVLGADVSYPLPPHPFWTPIEKRTASDWRQAWQARQRKDISVYISLSEKAGVPLALVGTGKVPHVLIAHHLTSERKRALQKKSRYLHRFARVVVLGKAQGNYLKNEAQLSPERIRRVYDKVDHRFWMPATVELNLSGPVVSVGRERRDYDTLVQAGRLLPSLRFVVVASSPWSRGNATGEQGDAPSNVQFVRGLSWCELRNLYASASVVVVPLQSGTDYAAGVNAVLEAQAMQKPLIVTQTPGIADYVSDNFTARVVPPQNAQALANAITELQGCPELAKRLATNGRRVVEDGRNLDTYVSELAQIVREIAP